MERKGRRTKIPLNCGLVVAMAMLLLSCLAMLVTLGPKYLFVPVPSMKIGILCLNQDADCENLANASINKAVEDINKSIKDLRVAIRPPMVEISLKNAEDSRGRIRDFEHLYSKGYRIFYSNENFDPQLKKYAKHNKGLEKCHFLSSGQLGFREDTLATSYLDLIDKSNPSKKVLHVIPVVKSGQQALAFYETLLQKIHDYPNLKLTSPVLYEGSDFADKTEALQIVSHLGTQVALHPQSVVFFLSSDQLKLVIETSSRLNKELKKRRWFARNLTPQLEQDIMGNNELNQFCLDVSLTTLTFMGDSESDWNVQLRSEAFKSLFPSTEGLIKVDVLKQVTTYETIMMIHRAFTRNLYLNIGNLLESITHEGPFDLENGSLRRKSGLLVSLVFRGKNSNPSLFVYPSSEFYLDKMFKLSGKDPEIKVEGQDISTFPLMKSELKRLKDLTQCELGELFIKFPGNLAAPKATFRIDLSLDRFSPDYYIFPMSRGIQISFQCQEEAAEKRVEYACLPNKFNSGNFTCMTALISTSKHHMLSKRDTTHLEEGSEEKPAIDQDESLAEFEPSAEKQNNTELVEKKIEEVAESRKDSRDIQDTLTDLVNDTLEDWEDMVPSIMGCTASVAGCDFCFYFLSTYNVSASPAACIGGCSLGTFGSCTRLIGTAIQQSYDFF